ncbi:MAG: GAF domain-containing protein [Chlorobi bacterium]|nr:GAF domain-containing protein [Chlorobiota bacterium]
MNKNIQKVINYSGTFKGSFSFRPLIKYWEKRAATNKVFASHYDTIKKKLESSPELLEPIADKSLVEKNYGLVEELLNICFPPAIQDHEYYAAVFPESLESFYETPGFKRLGLFENQMRSQAFNENCCLTQDGRIVAGYAGIISGFCGLNVSYEYPIIYTRTDEKTGLERHYRIRIFSWFCEFKNSGKLREISEAEKKRLFDNLDNVKVLTEIIPPENFELEGFFIFNAVDITDQETLSSLKFDLIQKESIMSLSKFETLQHKLRTLLKKPEIKLGLIAFPSENKSMKYALKMGSSIVLQDTFIENEIVGDCKMYDEVLKRREVKIIYDVKDFGCSPRVEEAFMNAGIRNLLIAPLIYKDELIGILEIASSIPGELNKVNVLKLIDVYPLFAICIESSLDDLNKSVQSVIKEKCTAIHPSVEWRFRDAAMAYLNNIRNDIIIEMEDIVFENVYPFYGYSDVKDSSVYRNSAIQSDLIENLKLAQEIVLKISSETSMPILEELSFRINNQIENLSKGLSSSGEVDVIDFLRNEVVSTFGFLQDTSPEAMSMITGYRDKLDPMSGFLFKKRKEVEESIMLINETIASELDIQQDKAQRIFPHYFEKYKSDGVEHNIYMGDSLVADKKFNPMHLKSLRLWQLVTICIIAKKCIELKDRLSIPLDTTHLIYVQNSTLSIKFLYDEKKFDIANTFDVRHEIIKKRIDKAEIKGNGERLSGPGKIAIVYSQETEAEEYKQYIAFLKTKNYIKGDVESLELADMQGIHGLKALRVSVNSNLVIDKSDDEKLFSQTVKSSGEYISSTKN